MVLLDIINTSLGSPEGDSVKFGHYLSQRSGRDDMQQVQCFCISGEATLDVDGMTKVSDVGGIIRDKLTQWIQSHAQHKIVRVLQSHSVENNRIFVLFTIFYE